MCSGSVITLDDLPPSISGALGEQMISIPLGTTLEEAENIIIEQTLAANKGNKSKTAEILRIGRKTLYRKFDQESEE